MNIPTSRCQSCSSSNLLALDAEICLHSPGLNGLKKTPQFIFPKVLVCLECGLMQGSLAAAELSLTQNLRQVSGNPDTSAKRE